MKRSLLLATGLLAVGICAIAADTGPASEPAKPLIGEMRVATLEQMSYFYIEINTTLATISKDVMPVFEKLAAASDAAKIQRAGASIFRYPHGAKMDGPFKLQIGFAIKGAPAAPAGTAIEKLPAFKCATVLYTGPMKNIGEAYGETFQALNKAGLQPAGETREAYFYWENADSDNDVTQIQVAVK